MIPRPDGVRLKIHRAEQHLDSIDDIVRRYVTLGPYIPEAKQETDGRNSILTLRVRLREPIPEVLPVVVGDFVHNLRSSLDHLARGLVISSGGTPQDPHTAFPVRARKPKDRLYVAGGVDRRALALIKRLQPYNPRYKRPSDSPLYVLNELNIRDKHRQLNLTAVAMSAARSYVRLPGGTRWLWSEPFDKPPFPDGAVVGKFVGLYDADADTAVPEAPTWPDNVEMKVDLTTFVALGELGPEAGEVVTIQDRLKSLLDFVRESVALFDPFFERS